MLLLELVRADFSFFPGARDFLVLVAASGLALYMTVASIFAVFDSSFVPNIRASSSSHCKGIQANLSWS